MESERYGLVIWKWRAAVFVVLIAATTGMFVASKHFARHAREEQAAHELRVIMERVEQYRMALGGWPRAYSPLELLLSLRGRIDPQGRPINHPWFLDACWLTFENVNDKTVGTAILDPWGRPYQCAYIPAGAGGAEAFVVASGGEDGRYSLLGAWAPGTAGTSPEDADNLALWSGGGAVVGYPR